MDTKGIIIEEMINYFAKDIKRINHALKVYGFVNCIARNELTSENEILTVDLAAILHDIGIKEAEKNIKSPRFFPIRGFFNNQIFLPI